MTIMACFKQGISPAISQALCLSEDMGLSPKESYVGAILVSDGIETIQRLTKQCLQKRQHSENKAILQV